MIRGNIKFERKLAELREKRQCEADLIRALTFRQQAETNTFFEHLKEEEHNQSVLRQNSFPNSLVRARELEQKAQRNRVSMGQSAKTALSKIIQKLNRSATLRRISTAQKIHRGKTLFSKTQLSSVQAYRTLPPAASFIPTRCTSAQRKCRREKSYHEINREKERLEEEMKEKVIERLTEKETKKREIEQDVLSERMKANELNRLRKMSQEENMARVRMAMLAKRGQILQKLLHIRKRSHSNISYELARYKNK